MSEKIYNSLNTILPVSGGMTGALSQAYKIIEFMPTIEAIVSTIVLTALGGLVGYMVKLVLDRVFKRN